MTYEELVVNVKKAVKKSKVSKTVGHVAFQFNVEGEAEGAFYLEVDNGKINVEPYEYYDRNAIITVNPTNFIKLINGKLDPVAAFTSGKLSVDGDVNAALEMIKYIKA